MVEVRNAKIEQPAEQLAELPKLKFDQCGVECTGASNLKRHIKNFHLTAKRARLNRHEKVCPNKSKRDVPSKRPQYIIAKKTKRAVDPGSVPINSNVLWTQNQAESKSKCTVMKSEPMATRSRTSRLISKNSSIQNPFNNEVFSVNETNIVQMQTVCIDNQVEIENSTANVSISSDDSNNVVIISSDVVEHDIITTTQTHGNQLKQDDCSNTSESEGEPMQITILSQDEKSNEIVNSDQSLNLNQQQEQKEKVPNRLNQNELNEFESKLIALKANSQQYQTITPNMAKNEVIMEATVTNRMKLLPRIPKKNHRFP